MLRTRPFIFLVVMIKVNPVNCPVDRLVTIHKFSFCTRKLQRILSETTTVNSLTSPLNRPTGTFMFSQMRCKVHKNLTQLGEFQKRWRNLRAYLLWHNWITFSRWRRPSWRYRPRSKDRRNRVFYRRKRQVGCYDRSVGRPETRYL